MAASENSLFDRDNPDDNHSDIWDDTALIEAYDNAVKVVKSRLDAKKEDQNPAGGSAKPPTSKKKSKATKNQGPAWRPGQRCQAVYTEDGCIYEAVVKSVNQQDGTCIVRYLGYGNEERQSIKDLLPPGGSSNVSLASEGASESEGMEWVSPRAHRGAKSMNGGRGKKQRRRTDSEHSSNASPAFPPMFPPMMMQSALNGGQPSFPMPPHMFPSFPSAPNPPPSFVPPPPPAFEGSDDIASDQEALYSMLISWYMSGYHTGYYQGLKQSAAQADSSKSKKSPSNQQRS